MKLPHRISLARLPTPIQFLKKTSADLNKEIYVWRDDLTGFIDSGNKVRKLEFLVADALAQGCDYLITCGGPQSNHARATAAVARQLGLGVSLLLLPRPGFDPSQAPSGNLLLNQILGAKITWIDPEEFQRLGSTYEPFFHREMDSVKNLGKKPYCIPLGGSSPLGCYGYISGVSEMALAWTTLVPKSKTPDSIFCALGSGGTYVGLGLGLQANSLATKLFGINVIGAIETANLYVNNLTTAALHAGMEVNLQNARIIDGYVGAGYSLASNEDLSFYRNLASSEGIVLDPCYTGKAFQGMISEIRKNPGSFGNKILFLHSGGGFGNFAYSEQYQRVFQEKMI